jgi:hypothetical protein
VNDRDKSVPILTNIEDHVSLHIVGVFERAGNLQKIVPSNLFNYSYPCLDLVRRIRILLHSLVQMLAGNDAHVSDLTSQYVKASR